MDSIDSKVDLELIAALVDDRLSGEERARAVKLLATSDEALELFAHTVRTQHPATDVKVVPISSARRWRQWRVLVPVAAAAALAVVMVPRLTGSRDRAVFAREYAMELAGDPRFAGGLREGWDQRGWAVTRGGPSREGAAAAGSAAESRLAFRLGVRTLDLQIALKRGDTALATRLTTEVLETLNGIQYSDPVAASYTELKTRLATETLAQAIERASVAEGELRDLLGSGSFGFGQWVGAADLAAQTGDASFFESSHGMRFVQSTITNQGLAAEDKEALRSIEAELKQGPADRALARVHDVLQTVIRRRGG